MLIQRFSGFAIIATVALALPALAAQPVGGSTDRTPEASAAGPDGTLQKTHGDWRSAQLVGAAVYNDKDVNVGTIENLLVGSNGKVDHVVLSVGGFLGIGSKYVSVPFDQLKFERSQRGEAATPVSGQPNGSNGPSSAEPNVSPVTGHPTPGEPNYFSIMLPNATKASLTSMPAFTYG